jgi:hypothetical protein
MCTNRIKASYHVMCTNRIKAKFWYVPMSFWPEWLLDWFLISMEKGYAKEKVFVFQ